ncbi:MAG: hypothetical protein ACTSU3_01805 [Candidatus Thorarchaeota archaeon]
MVLRKMKLIERLVDVFAGRRRMLLGATVQPNDLVVQIYAIRAAAFLKITGRKLTSVDIHSLKKNSDSLDLTKDLSPSRRLLR